MMMLRSREKEDHRMDGSSSSNSTDGGTMTTTTTTAAAAGMMLTRRPGGGGGNGRVGNSMIATTSTATATVVASMTTKGNKKKRMNNPNRSNTMVGLGWVGLLGIISIVRILWGSFKITKQWQHQQQPLLPQPSVYRHNGNDDHNNLRPNSQIEPWLIKDNNNVDEQNRLQHHHYHQQQKQVLHKRRIQRRDSTRPTINQLLRHTSHPSTNVMYPPSTIDMNNVIVDVTTESVVASVKTTTSLNLNAKSTSSSEKTKTPTTSTTRTTIDTLPSKSSRILISGIVSHPTAMEFVLELTTRYNNTTSIDLPQMMGIIFVDQQQLASSSSFSSSRLHYLMKRLPHLEIQFVSSTMASSSSLSSHSETNNKYRTNDVVLSSLDDVIQSFQPTHVFHFETLSYFHQKTTRMTSSLSSSSSSSNTFHVIRPRPPNMYDTERTRRILDQLCKSIVKLNYINNNTMKKRRQQRETSETTATTTTTEVNVITLNVPDNIDSGFNTMDHGPHRQQQQHQHSTAAAGGDGDDNDAIVATQLRTYLQLRWLVLQTYHRQYNLNVQHINLPYVYGPYDDDDEVLIINDDDENDSDNNDEQEDQSVEFEITPNAHSQPQQQQQQRKIHQSADKSQPTSLQFKWIHIADAVDKIITTCITPTGNLLRRGMEHVEMSSTLSDNKSQQQQRRLPRLPVMIVGSNDTDVISKDQLMNSLTNFLAPQLDNITRVTNPPATATTPTTSRPSSLPQYLNTRLHGIISWTSMKHNPYESTTREIITSLSSNRTIHDHLHQNEIDNTIVKARLTTQSILKSGSKSSPSSLLPESIVSQEERRQHGLFPCQSECASTVSWCKQESVWSSDIISVARLATDNCRYLLYMADFSHDLHNISEVMESTSNVTWPRDLYCQVAFVSYQSPLVQDEIKQLRNNPNNTAAINVKTEHNVEGTKFGEFNGQLSINGWKLVWIQQDTNQLSESDLLLPKVTPGSLVSSNVTKAFYVELDHLRTIPPTQIVWFLMAKKQDSKALPARRGREVRSGTSTGRFVDLPATPSKHIMFFAHKFDSQPKMFPSTKNTKTTNLKSNDEALVSFVLKQKGRRLTSKKMAAFRRQWDAYRYELEYWKHDNDRTIDNNDDDNNHFETFEMIDTTLIIHQIGSSHSKRLRCEWYEEQVFWNDPTTNSNRYLEDLSLSYVLNLRRQRGRLRFVDGEWGEQMIHGNNNEKYGKIERKDGTTEDGISSSNSISDWVAMLLQQNDVHNANNTMTRGQDFVAIRTAMKARKQY